MQNTTVGALVVKATVDASGMNEDIVDGVDEAGPGLERKGKEHGDDYGDAFGEGLQERLDPIMEKLGKTLSRRLTTRLGKGLKEAFNDSSSGSLGARLGDSIGEAMANRIEETLAGLEDRFTAAVSGNSGSGGSGGGMPPTSGGAADSGDEQRLYSWLDIAAKFEAGRIKLRKESAEAIRKDDAEFLKRQESMYNTVLGMEKAKTKFLSDYENARAKTHEKNNAVIAADDARLVRTQQALYNKLEREAKKREADEARARKKSASEEARLLKSRGSIGDRIGSLFGAGSRNNAFNLLGRTLGTTVGLVDRVRQGAGSMFSTFAKGFKGAEEGASIVTRAMAGLSASGSAAGGSLSGAFSGLIKSGPAAAIAIVVATVALSAMVSVAGALLGIVVALASTIASALVGALAVASAGILAVVAAGGLLTVAFTSMTDAQRKAMGADFKPLKETLTGIGQLMITEMIPYFKTWADNLQGALELLIPLATVMGDAFGRAGNIITGALSGPGFQAFAQALGVYLPGIVTNLSKALGGFLNGALGLFAAIMPLVSRFAVYLADVGSRFSKFANSAEGRNAIVDFVDRAVDSLMSLWNFVKEFSGFVADILFSPQAQNAGNTLFDDLTNAFKGFRRSISSGDLERWFADAINFAEVLGKVIKSLGRALSALYNSKVLALIGDGLKIVAWWLEASARTAELVIDIFSRLGGGIGDVVGSMTSAIPGLSQLAGAFNAVADAAARALSLTGGQKLYKVDGQSLLDSMGAKAPGLGTPTTIGSSANTATNAAGNVAQTVASVTQTGQNALNQTSVKNGGYKTPKLPPVYKNPYVKWAQQFIDQGPSMAKQVKDAVKQVDAEFRKALAQAGKATSVEDARSGLSSAIESAKAVGQGLVDSAKSALSSAAQSLASASSASEAKKALKEVMRGQKDLNKAIQQQYKIRVAMSKLSNQKILSPGNVTALLNGEKVKNATLADYASARAKLAEKIEKANQKLADAISMRNEYRDSVAGSAKSFGSILSAQAASINGVTQALTATDITTNLQERLDKIKTFQENLRILLAQGLSNDAYKQLVDGGVENGSAYAAALVAGGQGAVSQVNSLTDQINATAESLGQQTADRLYQAGVDAAQGLVDGLKSLSSELDSAATQLGNAIARAIKKSLGIKSPSKVAQALMGEVGNGMVKGLDNQHAQVSRAANRLSSSVDIAPSMEVARYAAEQGRAAQASNTGVSGNQGDPRFRDLVVNTPTEDPIAVAHEVLNEVTGRL